jgi:hypothetical protein
MTSLSATSSLTPTAISAARPAACATGLSGKLLIGGLLLLISP